MKKNKYLLIAVFFILLVVGIIIIINIGNTYAITIMDGYYCPVGGDIDKDSDGYFCTINDYPTEESCRNYLGDEYEYLGAGFLLGGCRYSAVKNKYSCYVCDNSQGQTYIWGLDSEYFDDSECTVSTDYTTEKQCEGPWVVTYYLNYGDGDTEYYQSTVESKSYKIGSCPKRDRYYCIGWNESKDGSLNSYYPNQEINMDRDMQLYAMWKRISYTVTYYSNLDGDSTTEWLQNTVYEGDSYNIENTVPYSSKYIFLGWDEDKDAKSPTYKKGEALTVTSNMNLYAVWGTGGSGSGENPTPNTYTIKYDANGGVDAPAEQTKTEGVDINLSDKEPTRDGYIFEGWAEDSNATIAVYQPGDNYEDDKSIVLYAVWEEETTEPGEPENPGNPENPENPEEPKEPENPKTADILIYTVWAIGVGALGYSIYYFMKRKNSF